MHEKSDEEMLFLRAAFAFSLLQPRYAPLFASSYRPTLVWMWWLEMSAR